MSLVPAWLFCSNQSRFLTKLGLPKYGDYEGENEKYMEFFVYSFVCVYVCVRIYVNVCVCMCVYCVCDGRAHMSWCTCETRGQPSGVSSLLHWGIQGSSSGCGTCTSTHLPGGSGLFVLFFPVLRFKPRPCVPTMNCIPIPRATSYRRLGNC